MDVLIPVRCENDGWALRFSLRSLERYGANLGRVVISGGPFPDWLSGHATVVPCASPYDRKQKNILSAIMAAMSNGAIKGECLLSSDDHIMLRRFDLDAFPWFGRYRDGGAMPSFADYSARGVAITPYRGSIASTRALLESRGLPYDWVSGHVNAHIDAQDLSAVERLASGWQESQWGYEPATLFIACARMRGLRPEIVPRYDVKVTSRWSRTDIDAVSVGGDGLLSYGRTARFGDFKDWLEARFPEPSRWEKQ